LGIGLTLLIANVSKYFQQKLLPFIALLFAVMGIFTLPMMYLILKKNPITLAFAYLDFSSESKKGVFFKLKTKSLIFN